MSISFESENFKELRNKEKTDLLFLVYFIIMTIFSISHLNTVLELKTKTAYFNENIKVYETAIYGASSYDKMPIENIINDIKNFKKETDKKILSYNDLDNWKYIEFFINYHLNKIGQNNIKIGQTGINFVNFSQNSVALPIITNKAEDINYLLDEFNKSGYLESFLISKDGDLYTASIKLNFLIN